MNRVEDVLGLLAFGVIIGTLFVLGWLGGLS